MSKVQICLHTSAVPQRRRWLRAESLFQVDTSRPSVIPMFVLGIAMQSNTYLQEVQNLQSNSFGDWNTHLPSAVGKDRGRQQGAKRKEVKATASVRRHLMPLSLCCAGWGRSGMSR